VNRVIKFGILQEAENVLTSFDTVSFSSRTLLCGDKVRCATFSKVYREWRVRVLKLLKCIHWYTTYRYHVLLEIYDSYGEKTVQYDVWRIII